ASLVALPVLRTALHAYRMARIVVIESGAPARHLVGRILTEEGHEVREATDGAAGLELWHRYGADLVVTDIAKPGTKSVEAILELRTFVPALPIIVMTEAVGDLELLAEAHLVGTVILLMKPFSLTELLTVVTAALSPGSPSSSTRIA